jgi:hypothetical protein
MELSIQDLCNLVPNEDRAILSVILRYQGAVSADYVCDIIRTNEPCGIEAVVPSTARWQFTQEIARYYRTKCTNGEYDSARYTDPQQHFRDLEVVFVDVNDCAHERVGTYTTMDNNDIVYTIKQGIAVQLTP